MSEAGCVIFFMILGTMFAGLLSVAWKMAAENRKMNRQLEEAGRIVTRLGAERDDLRKRLALKAYDAAFWESMYLTGKPNAQKEEE